MKITYRNEKGEVVPGVSTVLSILPKPALIYSAWELGIKGLDYRKEWDKKSEAGTLTHLFIKADAKKIEVDTSDYSQNIIDKANVGFSSYLKWKELNKYVPIRVEEPIVDEELQVGGTPDSVGIMDDHITLLDYKTGKDEVIYPENKLQVLIYAYMLYKIDVGVEKIFIIKINRDNAILTPVEVPLSLMPMAVELFMGLRIAYGNLKLFK